MKKTIVYLLIFVLVVSSASFTTYNPKNFVSADSGAPGENKTTLQTWIITDYGGYRHDEEFGTQDIEIQAGGSMQWDRMKVYVNGSFKISGGFTAQDSIIHIKGPYFNVSGELSLVNCTIIFNATSDGHPEFIGLSGSNINITRCTFMSNSAIRYHWTLETGSHAIINHTMITDCGNQTNDLGMLIKSSSVDIDHCVFKDNWQNLNILDASPKIKNSTFHGGAHIGNKNVEVAGVTNVHFVSCKYMNISTEGVVNAPALLYEDYFVIVQTMNNTKMQGVGDSSVVFEDSKFAIVANELTINDSGPNQGRTQAVRCSGWMYTPSNYLAGGDSSLNPYTITVSDPWDEISNNDILPMNPQIVDVANASMNQQMQIVVSFIFDFQPVIKQIPKEVVITEDTNSTYPIRYHDRDYWPENPSELTIQFNSSYVKYIPGARVLAFNYPNGQPATSVVNVTLSDGVNNAYADINVTYIAVNDAPKAVLALQTFDVWEDIPRYIDLTLTDVDSPLSSVNVYSNRTQYVSYITTNSTLKVLYTNDFGYDGKQDRVEVWAYDGDKNSSLEHGKVNLLITFHQAPDAPEIIKGIPPQVMKEDLEGEAGDSIFVDLNDHWRDIDYDVAPGQLTKPGWYVDGATKSSITVSNQTFIMEITPLPDAFGNELITLYLEDPDGLYDSIQFWVNITSINDEPYTGEPSFTPEQAEAGEYFTFTVKYFDIENDAPDYVKLQVDGSVFTMTEVDAGDTNYKDGKLYKVDVQLFTEDHVYKYIIHDGTVEVTSEKVYTTKWPKIIKILRIKTKWSIDREFMVKIGYYSTAGGEISINENPARPGNGTYPMETTDVGFFYGVSSTIKNIQWIYVQFEIETANYTDVFVNDEEVKIRYYDPAAKSWNLTAPIGKGNDEIGGITTAWGNVSMDLSSEVIFAPLGPVNNDIDGDGEPNDSDEFPFDPTEQRDSDGDGVGDNADKFDNDPCVSKDSDNDGYPDEWMPGCDGSTVNPGLYLDEYPFESDCSRDFDDDDECDEKDDDDDGDGMPDLYEKNYDFLDPYDPSDAAEDYDGDGASNLYEYQQNTRPDDKKDVPPDLKDKDGEFDLMTIALLVVVIIVVLVLGLLMFMRKPGEEEEEAPSTAVPPPAPAYEYEQVPVAPPEGEVPAGELEPGMEAPSLPEGEAPPEEPGLEVPEEGETAPEPGTEYVVDESAGESMVPEQGEVIAEGEEAEELIEEGEADEELVEEED